MARRAAATVQLQSWPQATVQRQRAGRKVAAASELAASCGDRAGRKLQRQSWPQAAPTVQH